MIFKNNQHCKKTIDERFEEKYIVNPITDCWEWQALRDEDGYGKFWMNEYGRSIVASRASYIIYKGGEIPENIKVCHTCDNPPCVNPAHLFLGTHSDNMQDAINKGRKPIMAHPSLRAYQKGCRCEDCCELMKKYWRESSARKYAVVKQNKLLSLNYNELRNHP